MSVLEWKALAVGRTSMRRRSGESARAGEQSGHTAAARVNICGAGGACEKVVQLQECSASCVDRICPLGRATALKPRNRYRCMYVSLSMTCDYVILRWACGVRAVANKYLMISLG